MSLQKLTSCFACLMSVVIFAGLIILAGCSSKPKVVLPESLLEEQLESVPLVFPGFPVASHSLDTKESPRESWRSWIQWLNEFPLPSPVAPVPLVEIDQQSLHKAGAVWIPWLKGKADQGDITAQVVMGLMRQQGGFAEINRKDGIHWLDKAASGGNSFAAWQRALTMLHDQNHKDAVQLDKLLNQAVQEKNGYAELVLARLYRDGNRLVQDVVNSEKWYRKVLQQSSNKALQNNSRLNIGLIEWFGIGRKRNTLAAVKEWKQSAEAGDARGALLAALGQSDGESEALLKQAASAGISLAFNQFGLMNWKQENYLPAASLFDKGHQKGDLLASYNLSVAFYSGNGRPPNFHKALVMMSEPAARGDRNARRLQGFLYWQGPGPVAVSYTKARKAFTDAADQGDLYSYYALGLMAAIGQGEPRDLVTAWANLAVVAAWGVPEAATLRDIVVGKMTDQEQAVARKRAQTLFDNCKTKAVYLDVDRQSSPVKATLVKTQS
ncbi:sel1 repeat family protein [Sansalvadorimonas sp. 2012CJ34-2]|uniref:Sel1 repeat family protein n=1 Tax=Parendozoicomonas callyspongiae TaxID=2942213 RepID=A0ABT0PI96_9GAMM|nr:tetratricopeptide repeat protein [Sansalvadorimonas sp. 2012CJ34-2]MCL6271098.1 sel1 repeat family protein [Sansalvadorimonas sp. 2012CJ34-2]